jgi:hypothetical protein
MTSIDPVQTSAKRHAFLDLEVSAYDTVAEAMNAAGLRRFAEVFSGGANHVIYFDGRARLSVMLAGGFWCYPAVSFAAPVYEAIEAARAIKRSS